MAPTVAAVTTARINPELLPGLSVSSFSRAHVIVMLILIVLAGFCFRAYRLNAEGLSEDELNKVRAVAEYRAHGLTSANGEHPFLMKGLITLSVVAADYWNASATAHRNTNYRLSTETAVRVPSVIFGAFTSLLLFMVLSQLFGVEVALIAAALWALDPQAIGFNRIAKEDSFFLFFFLLANVFWLRGQREAEAGHRHPEQYYWLTAVVFGAMIASKYLPYVIFISGSYYYIFLDIPSTRWRVGKKRWLIFFAIMGVAFLLLNPTIFLPETLREMRIFAGEQRIGHDGYEFMGEIYRNQVSLWLTGSPWYFYFVFIGVKLPLPVVGAFIVGLPALFLRRLGDGRYFVLSWLFFWFLPFTVMGGKFTRYFTFALPIVLTVAAIGIHTAAGFLSRLFARAPASRTLEMYLRTGLAIAALAGSAYASTSVAPYYRLYVNTFGGGSGQAGNYFPHDEFYDARVRETAATVAAAARPAAIVASETPELFAYYARLAGRTDLVSVSLSDRQALKRLAVGDYIIDARGRRYFSNDTLLKTIRTVSRPAAVVSLGQVPSTNMYVLDEESHAAVAGIVAQ